MARNSMRRASVFRFPFHYRRSAFDTCQRIANLVRQARRQMPQCRHARGTLYVFQVVLQRLIYLAQFPAVRSTLAR